MARLRRTGRRLERVVLGAAMSVVAFIIERRLLKAIRDGGGAKPAQSPSPAGRVSVAQAPAADEGG